jgi:hypothetical protein
MTGGDDMVWAWDQANDHESEDTIWARALDAGAHELFVQGGSAGGSSDLAPRLGFIIFTNDPSFTPPPPNTL